MSFFFDDLSITMQRQQYSNLGDMTFSLCCSCMHGECPTSAVRSQVFGASRGLLSQLRHGDKRLAVLKLTT